jgi:hypothetical protein
MIEPMLADLAEAARRQSAAEQLAARVAGHALRPVLLCTLHIGGANLKSRATCDSALLPRSTTDVPAPLGQRKCRIYPENSYRLQAEAIRGLLISIRSQRLPWWRTHVPAQAAFQTQACCCQRDASIPYAWHKERAACRLTSRRE